jgi:hypothetical protein
MKHLRPLQPLRSLPCVGVLTLVAGAFGNSASAQAPVNEDFSSGALPTSLEISGTSVSFDGSAAVFDGPASTDRSTLRTVADDYYSGSFVVEVTVAMGSDIAFFGMGTGTSAGGEPEGPSINLRMHPSSILSGRMHWAELADPSSFQNIESFGNPGSGTHRLRMTWDASAQTAFFEVDEDYAGGTMVPDYASPIIDGSDNNFSNSNSRIMFGSSAQNGWQAALPGSFDDLSIVNTVLDTPPIADSGADFNVDEGQMGVILDGSGSSDPDNDLLAYSWAQLAGTMVALSGPSTDQPTFDAPFVVGMSETLRFQLTVTANGESDVSMVDVTINPFDSDGDGLSDGVEILTYGTDPNVADTDMDGLNDGDEVNRLDPITSLPAPTDPLNPDSDSDTLLDGDEVANGTDPLLFDDITPPTADPGASQSVQAGSPVLLDGNDSFDDTTFTVDLVYSWAFTSTPSGSTAAFDDASSSTPSFVADLPGAYVVELVVTDEAGLTSVPVELTVSSLNVAPTADAGDDLTVLVNGAAVLDGLGSSDPDGDAVTYTWTLASAPTGSMAILVGAATANPALTPDLEGEYAFDLVVNDGFVDSVAAQVVVTAIDPGDFAKDKVRETFDYVRALPKSAFDKRGHKRALLGRLRVVMRHLDKGRTFHAAWYLEHIVIPRVDGVALRGTVDPKGWWFCQYRPDWIVSEADQEVVYDCLKAALDALCS